MNNSDILQLFGRIFIFILAFAFWFTLAEVIYRHYAKNYYPAAMGGATTLTHTPKPYVMFTATPGGIFYGKPINKLGYRGLLPTLVKPKDEFRIFILGASFGFYGKPSFSEILQNLLNSNGYTNVKVFNYSIESSVSRQDLARLVFDVAGSQPDLVISFSGATDLFDDVLDPRINYPHRFIYYQSNPAFTSDVKDYKWFASLALGSKILRDLFPDLIYNSMTAGVIPENYPKRDEIREVLAKAYVQNLRLSQMFARNLGARYIAIFPPCIHYKKYLTAAEQPILLAGQLELAARVRSIRDTELAKFNDLNFYDWSAIFQDNRETIFNDLFHATPHGLEIIGQQLFSLVKVEIKKQQTEKLSGHLNPLVQNLNPEEILTY